LEAAGFFHHGEHVVRIAGNTTVWPGHILQLVHRTGLLDTEEKRIEKKCIY
jgi:hypothetical protein